jgi:hypothetical protein
MLRMKITSIYFKDHAKFINLLPTHFKALILKREVDFTPLNRRKIKYDWTMIYPKVFTHFLVYLDCSVSAMLFA